MAGCAGRRTHKRILCTCRVVPGCIAGHRLGLVGPSGVGSRSIVALGSTILRALLVLRGVLGPYSSQGHVTQGSGGNTQQAICAACVFTTFITIGMGNCHVLYEFVLLALLQNMPLILSLRRGCAEN